MEWNIMKKRLFMGLVTIAVLVSGCFQPKANINTTIQQQGGATPTPMPVTPSPTPASVAKTTQITINVKNFEFSPVTITISKRQTITWTNMDSVSHTITSTTGDFDSGHISQGQTFSYTFNKAGTFEYSCTIHPNIPHGRVIVTE